VPAGSAGGFARIITGLPTHGKLFDGTAVAPDQEITATGWVVRDAQGRVLYQPEENYAGPDWVSYKVRQGWIESSSRLVPIIVRSNHPPVAKASPVLMDEDTEATFPIFGTDADGDTITASVRLLPANGKLYQVEADGVTRGPEITESGTAVTNPQGLVRYVPSPDFNGVPVGDTLRYDLFDGRDYSFRITVNIGVTPLNDPPWARAKVHSGKRNNVIPVILDIGDVDSPIEGRITQFPPRGKLYRKTVSADNLITPENNAFGDLDLQYAPEEPFTGDTIEYTFGYELMHEGAVAARITDTLRLEPAGLAPEVTSPLTMEVVRGIPTYIVLNGNDPDGESDHLLFEILTLPQKGTLAVRGIGGVAIPFTPPFLMPASTPEDGWILIYTSNANASDTDSFAFTLRDEQGLYYTDSTGDPVVTQTINIAAP
jgi:hypothetical protein